MDNMKWHDEFDIFRRIKPCIILEGNVLDRFHYPGDPDDRMRDLAEYVYCFLTKHGYGAVAYYDPSYGFFDPSYNKGERKFSNLCARVSNANVVNGYIKCSFSGSQHIEPSSKNTSAPPTVGEILSSVLDQAKVPSAVIVDMASRLIISPDQIGEDEVKAFANIQRIIRKSKNTIADKESTKNLLVLIVNKVNDLPAWFFLGNPDVKTIQVLSPNESERRDFISGEKLNRFFDPEVWKKDQLIMQQSDGMEKVKKVINRFVGLTEGFSYSDLLGMRVLCRNEKFGIMDLPKVVDFYRFGIRENKWNTVSFETVHSLENDLTNEIVGQELAKGKILDVVKRSVVQRNSGNNRPKGILFFAGPTGTGKTESAKILAKNIFGDQSCCIRFDMSEYRQEQSDQKLLGAPPGYIGYESGGQLTNAVRNNPFSILLFDEIEKAHPSIMDKFLQILDDGRLTDGQGNTVYFSESIIIFTSNKGIIEEVQEQDQYGRIRFVNKQLIRPEEYNTEQVQQQVISSVLDYFKNRLGRPELLNRIGVNNIVVFDFIRPNTALQILDNQIKDQLGYFKNNLEIDVRLSDMVKNDLRKQVQHKKVLENGGRGIRTMVENLLYTPVCRYIYDHKVLPGQTIIIKKISGGDSPFDRVELNAEVKN